MSLLSPQLDAFMAVVKAKTVHGAAQLIHITQTAVTQRIKNLEKQLKTTLFVRSRRGMLLTTEGEALLRYCHAAKALEGEALAAFEDAGVKTAVSLRISAPSSLMRTRVIPSCLQVMKDFPHLLLEFDVEDSEIRHHALRSGQCDFAVIQPEDIALEMAHKLLEPERYLLLCSPVQASRKLEDILAHERIIDFDPNDQMTFNYLKHFDLLDVAQHERHFVNSAESLAKLISAGVGYGVLTDEFARPYIEQGDLITLNQGFSYENKRALVWYKRPEPPKYFQAIIEAII